MDANASGFTFINIVYNKTEMKDALTMLIEEFAFRGFANTWLTKLDLNIVYVCAHVYRLILSFHIFNIQSWKFRETASAIPGTDSNGFVVSHRFLNVGDNDTNMV